MKYDFSCGKWNASDFIPAASVRVSYRLPFGQDSDCIQNVGADKAGDEYAYVSMVAKEKAALPCRVETRCDFVTYGAPLIVLCDDLRASGDGKWEYGHHIEVVGWEKGVNVWDLTPDKNEPSGQKTVSLGKFSCPQEGKTPFDLFAEVTENGLTVGIGNTAFSCPACLKGEIYVGVTACEGENRFYSLEIQ